MREEVYYCNPLGEQSFNTHHCSLTTANSFVVDGRLGAIRAVAILGTSFPESIFCEILLLQFLNIGGNEFNHESHGSRPQQNFFGIETKNEALLKETRNLD